MPLPNLYTYSMCPTQGLTEEEATARALKIFETLDKNGDGSLAEEEFIKVGNSHNLQFSILS